MKLSRKAAFFASLCGLATIAIVGPVEGSASAATSATIGYDNLTGLFGGSGFTPGGLVLVQEQEGASVIGSVTVRASSPKTHCYYIPSEGWECYTISPGGTIVGTLSPDPETSLSCGVMVTGSVSATDETTGAVATEPVEWEGLC